MRPENLHDLLVGAVPPLTTPPDRMARVRRRVARTRGLRVSASVLGVLAVIGGAALGAHALAPAGRSGPNAVGQVPGASVAPSTSVAPSVEVSPSTGPSSGFRSIPPSGLGVGLCPQSLDLMSVDGAHRPDLTFQGPPASVTVCRYRHAAFDMSVGNAELLKGPKQGTPAAFTGPIQNVLNDTQPDTSGGCLYPSPYQNLSVDVVYAVDAHGNKLDFYLMRIVCTGGGNGDAPDLTAAIDRLMGTPY